MQKQYGPFVDCDLTGDSEMTHRPGNSGPFFCFACGSINHDESE